MELACNVRSSVGAHPAQRSAHFDMVNGAAIVGKARYARRGMLRPVASCGVASFAVPVDEGRSGFRWFVSVLRRRIGRLPCYPAAGR